MFIALFACGSSPPPAEPPTGTLLFVSEATGGPVAMVLSPQEPPRPLTTLPGATFPAAVDPQGTHALVVSAADSSEGHVEQLLLVPLAGGAPTPLGVPSQMVRNPAWARDGAFVVYESDQNSYRDLYRADRTGEVRRLTDAPHGSFEPDVAPDGKIVFGTSRDANAEVYIMNADGSGSTRLTVGVHDDVMPRFSPDGQRVAFVTHREGVARVWHMSPEGRDQRALRPLQDKSTDLEYAWAPDSRHVAVVVQTGPAETAIEIVDAVTGLRAGLIDGPGVDDGPTFTPDGRFVVHSAARGGTPDVYIATLDGKVVHRLTTDPRAAWLPRWLP